MSGHSEFDEIRERVNMLRDKLRDQRFKRYDRRAIATPFGAWNVWDELLFQTQLARPGSRMTLDIAEITVTHFARGEDAIKAAIALGCAPDIAASADWWNYRLYPSDGGKYAVIGLRRT